MGEILLEKTDKDQILFYAFWLRRNEDESNIGYGVNKKLFIFGIIMAILLTVIVALLLITNMLSLIKYFLIGFLIYQLMFFILLNKHIAWFEVNNFGEPINLISKGFLAPSIIKNRSPISKKRFLQEAKHEQK